MIDYTIADVFISLIVALFCGGLIGQEREKQKKAAGIRTHIIVCIGACVVALIQRQIVVSVIHELISHEYLRGSVSLRPSDMLANVLTGVGFLGAGTIIVNRGRVEGLTTAASIWSVAIVGIAIGMGFWIIVIPSTIIIFLTLRIVNRLSLSGHLEFKLDISYLRDSNAEQEMETLFDSYKIVTSSIDTIDYEDSHPEIALIELTIQLPKEAEIKQLMKDLSKLKDIRRVQIL